MNEVNKVVADVDKSKLIASLELPEESFNALVNMKETVGRSGVTKKLVSYLKTVKELGVQRTRVNIGKVVDKSGAHIDYYCSAFKEIRDTAKEIKILDIEAVDGLQRKVKEFVIQF